MRDRDRGKRQRERREVTMIPKGDKSNVDKKNSEAKILNRVLTRQIQQHVSVIIHHDQLVFISWIQLWSKTNE